MKIIRINYRDDSHNPKFEDAKILETGNFEATGQKILLVDDVSKSGATIKKAKQYLRKNEIKTCIINGVGDYFFFQTKSCLEMPWKR